MEKYVVTGGAVLKGDVTISGAKNAVVAIIPATILARDICVIENIPNISDVTALLNILRELGAKVRLLDKTTVEIDTTQIGGTGDSPTSWQSRCAPPITSWVRCWDAAAVPMYRCRAAATLAESAPSTSTSRASRPWERMIGRTMEW